MNHHIVLTSASGSGKTFTAQRIAERQIQDLDVYFFDSIGVPDQVDMVREYGSGENWQRAMTFSWIERISKDGKPAKSAIFDGQMRLAFVTEACAKLNVANCQIVLFDCDDKTRMERLGMRGQPELASAEMMNWARYLREEAKRLPTEVTIDTSALTVDACAGEVQRLLASAG